DVTAMPPDGADLHPAHRLPDVLPVRDFALRNHCLAIGGHHCTRDWRHLPKNFRTDPSQDGERKNENCNKDHPKPFHIFSFCFQVKCSTLRHSLYGALSSSYCLRHLEAGDELPRKAMLMPQCCVLDLFSGSELIAAPLRPGSFRCCRG